MPGDAPGENVIALVSTPAPALRILASHFASAIRSSTETNRERMSADRFKVDKLLTSGNTSPCCSRVGAVFPDDACFNTVDRSNRRREEADVSSGNRVYDPNAQVAPTRLSRRSGNPEPFVSISLVRTLGTPQLLTEQTGPMWTGPPLPHLPECGKGLWIPAAVRKTGVAVCPNRYFYQPLKG